MAKYSDWLLLGQDLAGVSTNNANISQGFNNWFTGNLDYARELESLNIANDFTAEEAQKARDWQEYMSNTAYQRQAADLEAAGYNPALVLGAGGASSYSTSAASSASPHSHSSGGGFSGVAKLLGALISIGATSALKTKAMAQQLELNNAKIDTLAAQTSALEAKSKLDNTKSALLPGTNWDQRQYLIHKDMINEKYLDYLNRNSDAVWRHAMGRYYH